MAKMMSKNEGPLHFMAYINGMRGFGQHIDENMKNTVIRAIVKDQDFTVHLAELAAWLGVREDHLKRKLCHYEKGKHYKEIVECSAGGRPKMTIWLSMYCCKQLASKARGVRAEQVRAYFIKMDSKYRQWLNEVSRTRSQRQTPKQRQHLRKWLNIRQTMRGEYPKGQGVYVAQCNK